MASSSFDLSTKSESCPPGPLEKFLRRRRYLPGKKAERETHDFGRRVNTAQVPVAFD